MNELTAKSYPSESLLIVRAKLMYYVTGVADSLAQYSLEDAISHKLRGVSCAHMANDLGIIDDEELGLWNHRLKYGRMKLTKKERNTWL